MLLIPGSLAIRQVLYRAMGPVNQGRESPDFPPDRIESTGYLITRLARQGVPLDRRMKLAGHRDPNMNLAYGEVEPESLRDAIAQTFDTEVGT